MPPSTERRVAIDAARAAGRLLHAELRGSHRIQFKGLPTNLVTEMDERAEELIVGQLAAAFPDDTILAEERGAAAGRSGRRWIVDPLDGTTNYAHGVPIFSVSIALEVDRRVELGVAYDPIHDELYVAERGRGATVNEHVVVGPRAMIETGARVSDTVLHERAVIEPDAVVERSILGPGATVMRGASVRDSVLGEGAVVGGGASVREGRVQPGERVEA